MRAIRVRDFGAPEVLRVEDAPEPVAGPGEVLVRVGAAGVNPVDTYVRSGTYRELPGLPYTPGSDAGGVIAALGPGGGWRREVGAARVHRRVGQRHVRGARGVQDGAGPQPAGRA